MTSNNVPGAAATYAARLTVDYPDQLDRLTTFFRIIWVIPIAIVLIALSAALWLATALMIVFRQPLPALVV